MATKASSDDGKTPNGVKLIGELVVPGASQFIDGNIRSGGVHLLGAMASMAILGGPVGLIASLLVRGNSYTTSTMHKPLFSALTGESAADSGRAAT
jgi:hypothetical protein